MIRRANRSIGSVRRRAFTLVESLAVVVVLAVAIPPAVSMMADSARAQADSVTITRATWFASALIEQIIADVNSDDAGLGFAALDDSDTYLTTPSVGFEARNSALIAHYGSLGLTHGVLIGELSNASGTVVGDIEEDIFRTVTVSVTWTTLKGDSRTMGIGCVVTDL